MIRTASGHQADQAPVEECAICGEMAAHASVVRQEFAYLDGNREVVLEADTPVLRCDACGETYAGADAEDAQHEAVCHHLGRLSPREIRALRDRLGITQARLAELTKIGIASIKRWETGNHIQNASLDARLRALDTDAAGALQARGGFRFRFDPEPDAINASRRFELRARCDQMADAA